MSWTGEGGLWSLTYLPTPQVAAGWSLEYKDIIGVEGGGPGCNLKSLGVIGTGSPDLEQPCGGHRLRVVLSGSASLRGVRGRQEDRDKAAGDMRAQRTSREG